MITRHDGFGRDAAISRRQPDFLDFPNAWDDAYGAQPRSHPVTICIAAVCEINGDFMIVGASDRKVTAGDVEFEPPTMKIYMFTHHIAALVAGDSAAQTEICDTVRRSRPQSVLEAVERYSKAYGDFNCRQAERAILSPLGLTMDKFLVDQRHMAPSFVENLQCEIKAARAQNETIICGIDDLGAQVYMIDRHGRTRCRTEIGFAAIGDGAGHAQSQFMFARYTKRWFLSRSLLLTYTAKKRAEVAPGVGSETDMFVLGAQGIQWVLPPVMDGLETVYCEMCDAQDRAAEEANKSLDDYMRRLEAAQYSEQELRKQDEERLRESQSKQPPAPEAPESTTPDQQAPPPSPESGP